MPFHHRQPPTTQSKRTRAKEKAALDSSEFGTFESKQKDRNDHEYIKNVTIPPSLSAKKKAALIQVIKNEIALLDKCGRLGHRGVIKNENTISISIKCQHDRSLAQQVERDLQKYSALFGDVSKKQSKMIEISFKQLIALHERGVAHLNPRPYNFLITADAKNSTAVDFAWAQSLNSFNWLEDYARFYNNFSSLAKVNGDTQFAFTLLNYYVGSIKEYLQKNQRDIAYKLFAYAIFSIAGAYGLGSVAAAKLLVSAACRTFALHWVTTAFDSIVRHNQVTCTITNRKNPRNQRTLFYGEMIVAALVFTGLYQSVQAPGVALQKIMALLSENSLGSRLFWQNAMARISVLELSEAALFCVPLHDAYQLATRWTSIFRDSPHSLDKVCDRYSDQCSPRSSEQSWTRYFGLSRGRTPIVGQAQPSTQQRHQPPPRLG